MKKLVIVLTVLVVLDFGIRFIPGVHAQGNVPYAFSVSSAQHTACTPIPSVTTYCYADDGAFQSLHGAAFTPMVTPPGVGLVTSVFGRTGDVVAKSGDYTYAQIANPPTFVTSFAGRNGIVVPQLGDYTYTLLNGTPPIKPAFGCTQVSLINGAVPALAANGCN